MGNNIANSKLRWPWVKMVLFEEFKKFSLFLVTLVVSASLVFAPSSEAKIYKWRDENGKLHFTDDPSKVPEEDRPTSRANPKKQTLEPSQKPSRDKFYYGSKNEDELPIPQGAANGIEKGFEKMGDALGKGLQKGMEKMGEALGKSFEGLGELMVIAEKNKPDVDRTDFASEEEKAEHEVQQALLGMFMVCQMQYIMKKIETCSKDGLKKDSKNGWKVDKDSKMNQLMENHTITIDPKRNTRNNLLIKANQNNSKNVWQITHEGKSSIQLVPKGKK
ncbi:MAG: DUF4124 domain-containing protein [Nitrospinota bacterium]